MIGFASIVPGICYLFQAVASVFLWFIFHLTTGRCVSTQSQEAHIWVYHGSQHLQRFAELPVRRRFSILARLRRLRHIFHHYSRSALHKKMHLVPKASSLLCCLQLARRSSASSAPDWNWFASESQHAIGSHEINILGASCEPSLSVGCLHETSIINGTAIA